MPNFKYTDNETRMYPAYGIAITGRVIQADTQPDPRWEQTTDPVTDPPKAPTLLTYGSPYEVVGDDTPAEAKPITPPAAMSAPEAHDQPIPETPVQAPEAPAAS